MTCLYVFFFAWFFFSFCLELVSELISSVKDLGCVQNRILS